jgi:hypothetical protein
VLKQNDLKDSGRQGNKNHRKKCQFHFFAPLNWLFSNQEKVKELKNLL